MQVITTVTQKGQVTLPKKVRDALGIQEYDKVLVEIASDHVKIRPTVDIFDLAGSLHPQKNKNKSPLQARRALAKQYRRF